MRRIIPPSVAQPVNSMAFHGESKGDTRSTGWLRPSLVLLSQEPFVIGVFDQPLGLQSLLSASHPVFPTFTEMYAIDHAVYTVIA